MAASYSAVNGNNNGANNDEGADEQAGADGQNPDDVPIPRR